ncbi:unnamed protein product, partial [Prorocentrum cordatum]
EHEEDTAISQRVHAQQGMKPSDHPRWTRGEATRLPYLLPPSRSRTGRGVTCLSNDVAGPHTQPPPAMVSHAFVRLWCPSGRHPSQGRKEPPRSSTTLNLRFAKGRQVRTRAPCTRCAVLLGGASGVAWVVSKIEFLDLVVIFALALFHLSLLDWRWTLLLPLISSPSPLPSSSSSHLSLYYLSFPIPPSSCCTFSPPSPPQPPPQEIECCLDYECEGCSGEQCTYCRRDHQKGCCLGKWMAKYSGKCDDVSLPDYESCPKCGPSPCPNCTQAMDIDACLDDACRGCSGEQCTYCRKEYATVQGCCLGKWAASYTGKCDDVSIPDYLSCGKCGGEPCPICVQQRDVQFCQQKCSGCSGEQCTYCREECCKGKSFAEYIPECE